MNPDLDLSSDEIVDLLIDLGKACRIEPPGINPNAARARVAVVPVTPAYTEYCDAACADLEARGYTAYVAPGNHKLPRNVLRAWADECDFVFVCGEKEQEQRIFNVRRRRGIGGMVVGNLTMDEFEGVVRGDPVPKTKSANKR